MAEYLVRGALLACDCGTHARKLNLLQSHGIYINDKAQILESDCVVEENISYFGICHAETKPKGAENITLVKYGEAGKDGATVAGCKCRPEIIGKWRGCMEKNLLQGDEKTVTTDSFLICRCGGLIQPLSSGQEDS